MVIKMNNISFKIVIIFLICIFLCCSYSLAADTTDDIIGGADNFIKKANTEGTIMQDSSQKAIDLLYNVFFAIGLVATVIVGVILGIQFMTASADGKAEVKEKLIPYTVGCVIVFGAFGIWKIVMLLLKDF